ncbi:hypothetical protein [Desulfomarina sp.]
MPNTLCHIGIQGGLGRFLDHGIDIRWIIAGCIIPDIPWIVLKILLAVTPINPYDLRLYCMTQASLLFCLLLSGAVAQMTRSPLMIFFILAANCLFHLLLDAIQIKWGNGVHLFAPFSWKMTRFNFLWPEHLLILLFTCFGLFFMIVYWREAVNKTMSLRHPRGVRALVATILFLFYLLGPILFMNNVEKLDCYYIHTLREYNNRPGKQVKFDRAHYFSGSKILRTFSGEMIHVTGRQPIKSGRVSFQGRFVNPSTVQVSHYHLHRDHRDLASVIGLFMACALVLHSVLLSQFRKKDNYQPSH